MEGLNFENVIQLLRLVAIIFGIAIFSWRFPSRKDMQKTRDLLRAEIRENHKLIIAFLNKTDAGLDRLANKLDADFQAIQAGIGKLTHKIEANTQVIREEMGKLADKVDTNTRAMNEKQWG